LKLGGGKKPPWWRQGGVMLRRGCEAISPGQSRIGEEFEDEPGNMAGLIRVPPFLGDPSENIEVSITPARIVADNGLTKRWTDISLTEDHMFARVMILQGALRGIAAVFGTDLLDQSPTITFEKFCQELRSRFPAIPQKVLKNEARQEAMNLTQGKNEKVKVGGGGDGRKEVTAGNE
jgi:hypothetical protein